MEKYDQIATDVLEKVGGRENVTFATHCVTRLRLNVRDKGVIDLDVIKGIPGVLGAQWSGEQLQVIIGNTINEVYDAFVRIGGFEQQEAIDENLDAEKAPFTIAGFFNNLMDFISGSLTPLIPVLIVAGLISALANVLGPLVANVISAESDLYRLFSFVGNAGFYFFPVLVGYSTAVKAKVNPIFGVLMGCIMLHPSLIDIVNAAEPFTVFGLPMPLVNYSSTVFPIMMSVYVLGKIESLLKRVVPDSLYLIVVPTLTFLIMLPISLCALGPLGSLLGNGVSSVLLWLESVLGPIGIGVIAALYIPLVATGMHLPLIATAIVSLTSLGYDAVVLAGGMMSVFSIVGIDLGMVIKARSDKDLEALSVSCLVSQVIGGIGEPAIFGLLLPYRKLLAFSCAGGFVGGVLAGVMKVKVFMPPISNFLVFLGFIGGDGMSNLVSALVSGAISFAVSLALVLVFGYEGGLFERQSSKKAERV
jgi:PTS system beta-glucosides-specific IIC component